MKIVRVNPGHFGLIRRNGVPAVLLPGRHVINDPLVTWVGFVSMTDPHIQHGTIHIITVPGDQIGLCNVEGDGFFLGPGKHKVNHPRFVFVGMRPCTDEHVSVGRRHRIVVPAGRIGLGWEQGEAVVLEPGKIYEVNSPMFSYAGSVDVKDPFIRHGSVQFVTVKEGLCGVSFDDGALEILPPGRHMLTKSTHVFSGFLFTGQHTMKISEVTSMSSDNVGLVFDAAITVQIQDAKKAVTMLAGAGFSPEALYENIIAKAKLCLSIIIGNNRLQATFRSTSRAGGRSVGPGGAPGPDPSEPAHQQESFKQHIHDLFMDTFHSSMLRDCGILVVDMSIEDIRISNPDLASAMAKGAVAATELDKAQIELQITQTRAEAEQRAEVTRAEGRARAMGILATAEAERVRSLDDAMKAASAVTQQRELVRAAAEVMGAAKSSIILASNVPEMARLLGGGGGGGLGLMPPAS